MRFDSISRASGQHVAAILLVLLGLALGACSIGSAQTTSGAFVGRVTDSSGKVLVGASVTLANETTGIRWQQATGNAGEYAFNSVPPGIYRLTVAAPGFASRIGEHIKLDVQQTLRQDIALEVGSATATVSVTAAAPMIQTESTEVGNIVEGKTIQEAPLNGRENPYSLMRESLLADGVGAGCAAAELQRLDFGRKLPCKR